MRFFQLVPIALVASSASASLVLPLAVSGGLKIVNRDISSSCTKLCTKVQNQYNACGTDLTCACTTSIATQLEKCVDCQVEGDPSSAQDLQTGLDQYASGCSASGNPVGSLTVSVPASVTSTASSASGSATTAVLTSTSSTPPAFASSSAAAVSSTSEVLSSASAAVSSAISSASASSTSASASATTSASGNSATAKDVRMTGALVAAGLAAIYAVM